MTATTPLVTSGWAIAGSHLVTALGVLPLQPLLGPPQLLQRCLLSSQLPLQQVPLTNQVTLQLLHCRGNCLPLRHSLVVVTTSTLQLMLELADGVLEVYILQGGEG